MGDYMTFFARLPWGDPLTVRAQRVTDLDRIAGELIG